VLEEKKARLDLVGLWCSLWEGGASAKMAQGIPVGAATVFCTTMMFLTYSWGRYNNSGVGIMPGNAGGGTDPWGEGMFSETDGNDEAWIDISEVHIVHHDQPSAPPKHFPPQNNQLQSSSNERSGSQTEIKAITEKIAGVQAEILLQQAELDNLRSVPADLEQTLFAVQPEKMTDHDRAKGNGIAFLKTHKVRRCLCLNFCQPISVIYEVFLRGQNA
jgi:hypothetical protein